LKASSAALQSQLASAKAETVAAKADAAAAQANVTRAEQGGRSRIAELEDEIAQLRLRQRLLDEEMIKAEGQIDLIKDVLLPFQ
jgi:chromosome segregation ATPase